MQVQITELHNAREKYRSNSLSRPQKKYKNHLKEIDSMDFSQEFGTLTNFL